MKKNYQFIVRFKDLAATIFEKIYAVMNTIGIIIIIIMVVRVAGYIQQHNEQVKAQKCETVIIPVPESCPIAVQGKCLPLKTVTAINMNEIAGRDGIYEVQMVFLAGEEKPILKVEKAVQK